MPQPIGWIPVAALTAAAVLAALALAWRLERRKRRTHPMPGGLHPEITLPHEQEFELYHNALSLCSKKVRLALAELGIAYRSHPVDLIETGAYENLSRRFLAVNPAGLVPVLVHRGHPVYESHEIIAHAAAHAPHGAPALVPEDAQQRARMQEWIDRASLTGDDPIAQAHASAGNAVPGLTVPLFAAMIEDIAVRRILVGLLFHRLRQRPLLFLVMKAARLRRLHRLAPAVRVVARCGREMARHLDALEARLVRGGGPWIVGETFTLADVSWLPIFERLAESDMLHVFVGGDRRPACAAYYERLRKRPSHEAAIGRHTHPAVERATARIRAAKAADPRLRAALEPTR